MKNLARAAADAVLGFLPSQRQRAAILARCPTTDSDFLREAGLADPLAERLCVALRAHLGKRCRIPANHLYPRDRFDQELRDLTPWGWDAIELVFLVEDVAGVALDDRAATVVGNPRLTLAEWLRQAVLATTSTLHTRAAEQGIGPDGHAPR